MEDVIRDLGYVGLFALLLGENLFPPIPSEAILPLAGFLAGQGELNVVLAILVSTAGSVAGALVLYALGHRGGRALILRHGRLLRLEAEHLERSEAWFRRRGDRVVLLARCVPLLRSAVSVPAGTLRMPVLRFTVLTAIGSAVWNTALIGAGWALGAEWDAVSSAVGAASKVVLLALAALTAALGVWWWRRRVRPGTERG
ncbi:MAG: DedA family protein [Thermoleophilia bacterium]